jgi:hypothetical protein
MPFRPTEHLALAIYFVAVELAQDGRLDEQQFSPMPAAVAQLM